MADSLEFEGPLTEEDSLDVRAALEELGGEDDIEDARPVRPRPPRRDNFKHLVRAEEKLLDECVEKCAKVIALYPDSKWRDDAIFLMGKALFEKGGFGDALVKFSELRTHYPDSPSADEASLYEARCLEALGRPAEARAAWQVLRDSDAPLQSRRVAAVEMAASLQEEGRHGDAVKIFETARVDFPPVNQDFLLQLAVARRDAGDLEGAVEAFDLAAEEKGGSPAEFEARMMGAMVLADANRADEAVDRLRSLARDDRFFRQASTALLGLGTILYEAGKAEDAQDSYREVVNRYPGTNDAGTALLALARIYQASDTNLARRTYEMVIAEVPDAPEAKEARSGMAAIDRFEKLERDAAELEGDAAERSRFLLAENLLVDQNRPEKALAEYRTLITENPASPWRPRADLAVAWTLENSLDRTAEADSVRRNIVSAFPGTMAAAISAGRLGLPIPEVTVEDIEPVVERKPVDSPIPSDSSGQDRAKVLEMEAAGEVIETLVGGSSASRPSAGATPTEEGRSR